MAAPPAIQPESAETSSSRDMNDDVVTEILLRLPSRLVLRCRAVCKAWRRITSSPVFVAAHARRRPPELIFQRHGPSGPLETIPLATLDQARSQSFHHVRYPDEDTTTQPNFHYFWRGYALIASCGPLLLFERGGPDGQDFFVCNPVIRQWAMLPRLPGLLTLPCGFYIHRPSGEHRVLCLSYDEQGSRHYICSLEAAQVRPLGPALQVLPCWPGQHQPVDPLGHRGKLHMLWHPPVLSWTDDDSADSVLEEAHKIVAFDTVSETFRRMRRPPLARRDGYDVSLLEAEGMLAMAAAAAGSMHLWVLEDYDDDSSWTCRHRVDLPPPLRHACCWAVNAGVEERDVILLGDSRSCWAGLYDVTEKRLLRQIQLASNDGCGGNTTVRRYPTRLNALVFRDSLERHTFFDQ